MKKALFALLICLSSAGSAQVIDVKSITEISIPDGINAGYSTISPHGDYLLITDHGKKGLQKYDLATGVVTTLTDAPGAGYDVKILDDGQTIIYRETSFTKDKLKKTTLKSMNVANRSTSTLVSATRDLEGVTLRNGTVYAVKEGKMNKKELRPAQARQQVPPVFSISNGQLMITRNGKTTTFSPNGKNKRYLWPSLSPDGTKVLYYVIGMGSYICDLNGNNIQKLGMLRAPKWYNDSIVLGMHDISGEYDTEESTIYAITIDGKERQALTDSTVIAMYPSPSANGEKIVFSTPSGKTYLIQVNTQQ